MKKAEIIEALKVILVALEGENEETSVPEEKTETKKAKSGKTAKTPEPKEAEADDEEGEFTREELLAMKFNEMKKLGAKLGVDCKGTRDDIIERILEKTSGHAPEEEEDEEVEEKSESKKEKAKKETASKAKKQPEPDPEPEEEDDDVDFLEQAKAIIADNDEKDIISALDSVGIVVKKKKDLAKYLAKALEEDLLEFDGDDDDDTDEDEGDVEYTAESYFPEFDLEKANVLKDMSKKRKKAVLEKMQEIIDDIDSEETSEQDLKDFIEDFATDEEKELVEDGDEDSIICLYMEIMKRFIDDDGEEHEPSDCYEVNEVSFCCGHALKQVKKSNKYICPVCGEEYEA